MKHLLSILILAVTLAGQAQTTNGVLGSALPNAATLDGTEKVFVIQGGVTKKALVSDIQATPLAAVVSTNAALSARITAATNYATGASNTLAAAIAANTAADVTASNALAAATAAASAKDTLTSNAFTAALAGYYPTSNPSSYQTASQVAAASAGAAAAALAGAVQSNGVASFASVTVSNLLYSPIDKANVPATYFLDLGTASFQKITFTNTSGNSNLELTNWAAGQNVTVAVKNSTGSAQTYGLPNYFQTNVFNISANANTINSVANGRTLIFNFVVFSAGQIYMSYATAY